MASTGAAADGVARPEARAETDPVLHGGDADDELGLVYFAEEAAGIWRFAAEPDSDAPGKLAARVGDHGLTADVEGLTIYCARGGKGYLIASSQGGNTFLVYSRTPRFAHPRRTCAMQNSGENIGIRG